MIGGFRIVLSRGRTVLVADTAITEMPTAQDLAAVEDVIEAAHAARRLGTEPRRRCSAFSDFRPAAGRAFEKVRRAVPSSIPGVGDFDHDGEMAADVALNPS